MTSERAATDKETVKGMEGRSRRGRVERRGGRWREMQVGRLGKAEGWKGEETEREGDRHKRGRKTEGKTEGKLSQSNQGNERHL